MVSEDRAVLLRHVELPSVRSEAPTGTDHQPDREQTILAGILLRSSGSMQEEEEKQEIFYKNYQERTRPHNRDIPLFIFFLPFDIDPTHPAAHHPQLE